MTFEAWLSRLDPAQVSFAALAAIALGVFVWKKLWPWLVQDYFPSRARAEQERTAILAAMRDSLVELKVTAGQQVGLLQTQGTALGHIAALLEAERVILDDMRTKQGAGAGFMPGGEKINHASGG